MKRILVTGSEGFIGSRLVPFLRKKGYRVCGIDKKNCNIRSEKAVSSFFRKRRFDIVIHLAGEVGRLHGEEHPADMIQTNVLGTLNIIKNCLKNKCKLINFSTSEVYGLTFMKGDNFTEEEIYKTSPFLMTNVYGLSKFFGEVLVSHYVRNYGLQAISVRPFMIYGPGIKPSKYRSALDQFVSNALRGKILRVHKDSIRCWCHVDDFIRGIDLILKKHRFRKGRYEAYNVGFDKYIPMIETAKMIVEKIGKGNIKVIKPPKFLVIKKKVSFEKVKKLGFRQQISFEKGLDQIIAWHKSIL